MDTESLEEWWPGAGAGGHGELLCRDDSFRFLKERATELLHDNVHVVIIDRASQVSRTSACNAGDPGLISGSGRSPKGGNSNPLQYSCLENSMDTGAWRATVHVTFHVTKSRAQLIDYSSDNYIHFKNSICTQLDTLSSFPMYSSFTKHSILLHAVESFHSISFTVSIILVSLSYF